MLCGVVTIHGGHKGILEFRFPFKCVETCWAGMA
jgi:hypothetical protein